MRGKLRLSTSTDYEWQRLRIRSAYILLNPVHLLTHIREHGLPYQDHESMRFVTRPRKSPSSFFPGAACGRTLRLPSDSSSAIRSRSRADFPAAWRPLPCSSSKVVALVWGLKAATASERPVIPHQTLVFHPPELVYQCWHNPLSLVRSPRVYLDSSTATQKYPTFLRANRWKVRGQFVIDVCQEGYRQGINSAPHGALSGAPSNPRNPV